MAEDIPRAMGRIPLPPVEPPADAIAVVDAMLDKRPVDAALRARFLSPEAAAARAASDAERRDRDWPNLARYRAANAGVDRPELVMIGDSLTEIWGLAMPDLFGAGIVNRGISGQTSPQILLRFMADVVDLRPRRVHILCGTNDIAGNTGPSLAEDYQRNIRAMADLATANGIAVMLAGILPAAAIFWNPAARPQEWIAELNLWLREFARERGFAFLDYGALLDDGRGGLQDRYSADGVHVTRAAYRAMTGLLSEALDRPA